MNYRKNAFSSHLYTFTILYFYHFLFTRYQRRETKHACFVLGITHWAWSLVQGFFLLETARNLNMFFYIFSVLQKLQGFHSLVDRCYRGLPKVKTSRGHSSEADGQKPNDEKKLSSFQHSLRWIHVSAEVTTWVVVLTTVTILESVAQI